MSAAAPAREPATGRDARAPRTASAPARKSTRPVDPLAAPALLPGAALQRCACGGGCPACHAKAAGPAALPIHPADDVYEREADRVADAVMRGGTAPARSTAPALPAISRLQRCSCGGSHAGGGLCPECAKKQNEEMQRSASGAGGGGVAPPIVHEVLRSSGQPLDAQTRAYFEPRFGRGFGDVRVHTDARAAESARAVQAIAYTVGSNLVFGAGAYRPASTEGRRLLAHELTHVVQQSGSPVALSPAIEVGPVEAPEERAADAAANEVVFRGWARPGPVMGGPVLRRSTGSSVTCGGGSCAAADQCSRPDHAGAGGTATSGILVVRIDTERGTFYDALLHQEFGHTYVQLTDNTGASYTYGFYPAGDLPNEGRVSVPGCVRHPDSTHSACVDEDVMYSLTGPQFAAALAHAQEVCRTRREYHAQNYNCTTFAGDVVRAAGQSLPSMRGHETIFYQSVEADNPNTLQDNVRAERQRAPNERFPFWNNLCFNRCEAQFNTCISSGPGGGTCIARRAQCLRACPPG